MLVLFSCKDPSPLYKSSKRRNHLKPEYLETLFARHFLCYQHKKYLLCLTSYRAETKYLQEYKRPNSSFLFRFIHISTFKFVLISLLEIKSFVSLKNESSLLWTRGGQVLQTFLGVLLIRIQWGQNSRVGLISWTTRCLRLWRTLRRLNSEFSVADF